MNTGNVRKIISGFLDGEHAHANIERALTGIDPSLRSVRPENSSLPSVWELLEHMRIAQEDILRYTLEADWQSPDWPAGYWPAETGEITGETWDASVSGFFDDLKKVIELTQNSEIDLGSPIPHSPKHTYLREILLIIDHNAYHTGQIIQVRKLLSNWPA